jgi:RNA polymerase sigma factor (sigma-70 family)
MGQCLAPKLPWTTNIFYFSKTTILEKRFYMPKNFLEFFENPPRKNLLELFEVTIPIIKSHRRYLYQKVPAGDVQDLEQEIFLALWRFLPSIRDVDYLPGVISTITKRCIANFWRQIFFVGFDPSIGIEQDFDSHLLAQRAQRCLNRNERTLLNLIYFEGESYEDISKKLGIPREQVKNRNTRMLKKIRERLNLTPISDLIQRAENRKASKRKYWRENLSVEALSTISDPLARKALKDKATRPTSRIS